MSDIMERLKQLGVTKGVSPNHTVHPKPVSSERFEMLRKQFPDGIIAENEYGQTFNNRLVLPLSHSHGEVPLSQEWQHTAFFDAILQYPGLKKEYVLAMDTETSGLSTASAGFVFMIGMGYFTQDAYIVDQLILPDLGDEPAFLKQIEDTFARFPALVTYNGKAFDIPMIRSRSNFHMMPDASKEIRHIDLLYPARRYWKQKLGSVRLSNMENFVLHLQRGDEEVPGFMAPELYRDFLRDNDAVCLGGVAYHNHIDVVSLSALLLLINRLCAEATDNLNGFIEHHACPEALVRDYADVLSKELLVMYGQDSGKNGKKIAESYFRKKDFAKAASIYTQLLNEGDAQAGMKAVRCYRILGDDEKADEIKAKTTEVLRSDISLGKWSLEKFLDNLTRL